MLCAPTGTRWHHRATAMERPAVICICPVRKLVCRAHVKLKVNVFTDAYSMYMRGGRRVDRRLDRAQVFTTVCDANDRR